ncbi:MAG: YicC/YloC family endoribonuclease [Bdellovibrio sp.]
MNSMTGYGRSLLKKRKFSMEIQVRSVNSWYLETKCHLGREFLMWESKLKHLVRKSFVRGSIEIWARFSPSQGMSVSRINHSVLKAYVNELGGKKWAGSLVLSLEGLLRLPGVLQVEEDALENLISESEFLGVCEKAFIQCRLERQREGKVLQKHCLEHLEELERLLAKMKKLRTEANTVLSQRLQERWREKWSDIKADPSRLAQEVAFLCDKSDIDEELARLEEHLRFLGQTLRSAKLELGKSLDFYVQELHREVNTIGSKSQILELTKLVVEAKARIEKIREQAQNLE